jgi:hypothetical protein
MIWQQWVLIALNVIGLLSTAASYAALPSYKRDASKFTLAIFVSILYIVLVVSIHEGSFQ